MFNDLKHLVIGVLIGYVIGLVSNNKQSKPTEIPAAQASEVNKPELLPRPERSK